MRRLQGTLVCGDLCKHLIQVVEMSKQHLESRTFARFLSVFVNFQT